MTKELTSGSPMKMILGFVVPLMLGNLFQQMYSMVDAIIVGRFLGTGPFAAVGSTGSVLFLIIGFCIGVCSGFCIPVAQCFGARDYSQLRRYVGNAIWLCVGIAAVFTAVTMLLCRQILVWMESPADIMEDAYAYLLVIFAGIPVTILYNFLAALQRALGDSRTPVLFLVLASVLNIALDLLFVLVIPMGTAGVAVATVLAQLIAGGLCLVYAGRNYEALCLSRTDLRFSRSHAVRLLSMGLPMAMQTSITAIGNVILQTAVNTLGMVAVAGFTAGSKLYGFFVCAYDAMGVTMSTYCGQNLGAGKIDRIGKGVKACNIIGIVYSLSAFVVVVFCGRFLLQMFVDSSEVEIMDKAFQYLFYSGLFFVPLAFVNIFRLSIQGMGYSHIAIFAGVFEMVARGATGLVLVPWFGYIASCFAGPLAWLMADCFLIPLYYYVMRRTRRELGAA